MFKNEFQALCTFLIASFASATLPQTDSTKVGTFTLNACSANSVTVGYSANVADIDFGTTPGALAVLASLKLVAKYCTANSAQCTAAQADVQRALTNSTGISDSTVQKAISVVMSSGVGDINNVQVQTERFLITQHQGNLDSSRTPAINQNMALGVLTSDLSISLDDPQSRRKTSSDWCIPLRLDCLVRPLRKCHPGTKDLFALYKVYVLHFMTYRTRLTIY